ncbi:MAG: DUF3575 domain-containing protein [Bacteroidales bacterium]|jgi:hypothetical protein|nr:DUF3575 domain-containing protein [Bacteroidales bacterium]
MVKRLILLLCILGACYTTGYAQKKLGLKTNLLYWGTGTPNLGLEMGLGERTSVQLFGGYNPWNRQPSTEYDPANPHVLNKKLVHWVVQPEFRYWLCQRFNGHFFGVHGIYSQFNVGAHDIPLLFEKDYRYEGWAAGGGIAYGYHWIMSRRLSLEFTVGGGFLFLAYSKYDCEVCGTLQDKKEKTYVGPTKAAVSLIYMLK